MSSASARKEFEAEELAKETNRTNIIPDNYLNYRYFAASDLAAEFGQNFRKNIFGNKKKNSDDYDAIQDALKKIADNENEIQENTLMQKEPDDQIKSINAMLDRYNNLIVQTKVYLDEKNPHRPDGEARYKLVLRAEKLAREHINGLLSRLSTLLEARESARERDPDSAKQAKENSLFSDSLQRRRRAVAQNNRLSPAEKQVENLISDDLEKLYNLSITGNVSDNRTEQCRVCAMLMAKIVARNHMAKSSSKLPKNAALNKAAEEFIKNGMADWMLKTTFSGDFHRLAGIETSKLYQKILKGAQIMNAAHKDPLRLNKEAKKYAEKLSDCETWGLSQQVLDRLTPDLKYNSISAVMTIAAGLMLQSKKPVYSPKQVCDLNKFKDIRTQYGPMAVEILNNQNFEAARDALFTVGNRLGDYANTFLKNLPEINIRTLSEQGGRDASSVNIILYDAFQEFNNLNKILPPMKDHSAEDIDRLSDKLTTLPKIIGPIKDGAIVTDDPSRIPRRDHFEEMMKQYLTGSAVSKYVNELKVQNPNADIWNLTDPEKLQSNIEKITIATADIMENNLIKAVLKDQDCCKDIMKGMINDTLSTEFGLKVTLDKDGNVSADIDKKAIMKKFGIEQKHTRTRVK